MKYKYKPKNKEELIEAIKKEIYEIQGTEDNPNWQADLNCIDTSLVRDMSELFSYDTDEKYGLDKFNGNISKWDVSNVINMNNMFFRSRFNQDISDWDVSNVKYMFSMFAESNFNKPLNNWNVSNVEMMKWMFAYSEFNQDISNWNIDGTIDINNMFENSKFNGDIGNWSKKIKKQTKLENISISVKYKKLPDKVKYSKTIENINKYLKSLSDLKEKLIYEVQVIDRLDNKQYLNEFIDLFQKDFRIYLKGQKEKYKNKQPNVMKKLILKDILDIIKHTNNKELITKILNEKNINNNIDIKNV